MGWTDRLRDGIPTRRLPTRGLPRDRSGSPSPRPGSPRDYPQGYQQAHYRQGYPHAYNEHRPSPDAYWWWTLVGAVSPFVLSAILYPLVSIPVGAVSPTAGAAGRSLAALLEFFGARAPAASPGPAGPLPWQMGPHVGLAEAATWALAFFFARLIVGRVASSGGRLPDASPSERGFAAGSRAAVLAFFLLAVWWLGHAALGGAS